MSKLIDLTGKRFGRLVVIERAEDHVTPKGKKRTSWLCRCDCGNNVIVEGGNLKSNHSKSCGCLNDEARKKRKKRTGHYVRVRRIWNKMRDRCLNTKNNRYKHYGGRGITICDEWLHNFQVFYDWAMANGYQEELSIDRIDVNGNYCPENCRWATPKEQARNQRTSRYLTINGETKTLAEWCDLCGLKKTTVYDRLQLGWTPEEALGIVPRKKIGKAPGGSRLVCPGLVFEGTDCHAAGGGSQ